MAHCVRSITDNGTCILLLAAMLDELNANINVVCIQPPQTSSGCRVPSKEVSTSWWRLRKGTSGYAVMQSCNVETRVVDVNMPLNVTLKKVGHTCMLPNDWTTNWEIRITSQNRLNAENCGSLKIRSETLRNVILRHEWARDYLKWNCRKRHLKITIHFQTEIWG